jgi:hypothetical protein
MGEVVLPDLVGALSADDAKACDNVHAGIRAIINPWEATEPRNADLLHRLAASFGAFSKPGRAVAIAVAQDLLKSAPFDARSIPLLSESAQMLRALPTNESSDNRAHALVLAQDLADRTSQPEVIAICRDLVLACFQDTSAECRLQAVRMALRPELAVLDRAVQLLHDPSAEVRCAAMLALGPAEDILPTDDLLQWLHDPDAEVRALCEKALRGRGLQEAHLVLGRSMTDRKPAVRLKVVDLLNEAEDVEPGVWLRRLTHDPSSAVRAAAIRAATQRNTIDLSDRLAQMAENDPSPTVRQLAQFYLQNKSFGNSNHLTR